MLNAIPMIITKKISVEYSNICIKEGNQNTAVQKKNQVNTKEVSNEGNKGQKYKRYIEKKLQNGRSKPLFISNYNY